MYIIHTYIYVFYVRYLLLNLMKCFIFSLFILVLLKFEEGTSMEKYLRIIFVIGVTILVIG